MFLIGGVFLRGGGGGVCTLFRHGMTILRAGKHTVCRCANGHARKIISPPDLCNRTCVFWSPFFGAHYASRAKLIARPPNRFYLQKGDDTEKNRQAL